MQVSYSRVSSYLSCPYKHYLSYVECLTANKPIRALHFGSDFHKLLELRGKKSELKNALKEIEDTYYDMLPSHQAELGENYIESLKCIFKDYLKVYKKEPLPDVTEQEFLWKIGKYKGEPVLLKGFIDGLYKTENGIVVEEHKTFSRKPDISSLVMNVQKCVYAKATHFFTGQFPHSVMWDYIKSTPAKEPVWLEKAQRFSTAKSNQITPYSWLRACSERGIIDDDLRKEGVALYKGNIAEFFFRVNLDYAEEMVDSIWEGFLYTVKDICRQGEKNKTKNLTYNCSFCSFKPVCYAEMSGGDVEYIKEKDFTKKDRTGEQEVSDGCWMD